MNKIYSDVLSKVEMLTDGISKNARELEKKNIRIDCGKLRDLSFKLEEASKEQEKAEKALSEAREKAHTLLSELKAYYDSSKAPIKKEFLLENWSKFGIPDKR